MIVGLIDDDIFFTFFQRLQAGKMEKRKDIQLDDKLWWYMVLIYVAQVS